MSNPGFSAVHVELGVRSYDILIGRGAAQQVGQQAKALAPRGRALIVTDENLAALHLPAIVASFAEARFAAATLVLPAGEKTKSWPHLEAVVERIIAEKLERGDLVVALGGGVIGDLAGFAAAIARRGMRFIQIPTSLLAQVDSSVGGKTGINSPNGKNLIGAFHQPGLVIADTAILDTLPVRELRAGYAEVAKYGLIDKPAFFAWLEAGAWRGIFDGGPEREEAVRASCQAKADIVARDETETGDRALLNLGHTFGHALEALVAYDGRRLVHGEGVAIGMAMAHRFSAMLGLIGEAEVRRVEAHLSAVSLPIHASRIPGGIGDVEAMLAAIKQDKKVSGGTLTFILTRGIGQSFIAKGVPEEKVRLFLEADLALTTHG